MISNGACREGRALRKLPCDRSRAAEALEIAPARAIVVNPLVPRLGRHRDWQRLCAPHLPPPRGWWALAASTRSRVLHPHADLLWRPSALVCLSCMWSGLQSTVWQPVPMPQVSRLALQFSVPIGGKQGDRALARPPDASGRLGRSHRAVPAKAKAHAEQDLHAAQGARSGAMAAHHGGAGE
jgi:hypothetical protein